MRELHVDRMTLHLGALSERDGQRLAQLVADRLATASVPAVGATLRHASLQVDVTAAPGDALPRVAERIVVEILRQIAGAS